MEALAETRPARPSVVSSQPASSPAILVVSPSLRRELWSLLIAVRPKQWLKNGLVFMAFAFSVGEAWDVRDPGSWLPLLVRAVVAVSAFCAVASSAYLINDLRDIDNDRAHPRKRHRPLAAGSLRPRTAVCAAVALLGLGGLMAALLGLPFSLAVIAYVALTLLYSFVLKHLMLVDLITLAVGFVLRVVAGALAIGVPVSPWLYLCTLLGALFVAINKRRHELTLLRDGAAHHRPMLAEYSTSMLDQMATSVTASTILAYALYTVTAPNLPANHTMLATVPFVIYGIFRYTYLVQRRDLGGSPEEVLLHDRPLQVTAVLWLVTAMLVLSLARG